MKHTLHYDLTETLLAASTKRVQYYGIARTVYEIAREIATLTSDIRFVVFSFGKQAFYEIESQHTDRGIEFKVPKDVEQEWFRSYFGGNKFLPLLFQMLNAPAHARNTRRWDEHASGLKMIDIRTGLFVSAARPKLIVDMIKTIQKSGSDAVVVPLLHDFMPLHRGVTRRFRRFDRNFLHDNQFVIANSGMILTNSQFTRRELADFVSNGLLPPPGPVTAIPLVHQCPEGKEAPEIKLPPQPYLLTVGLNLGRKNIDVVLEALCRMAETGRDIPHLAIAGAQRKRLKRYIQSTSFDRIRNKLIFIKNPNQTDLVRLYQNALALVMPSRMEGWGLPAGESLWCGTPAICSTAPVFQEVCGKLGLYFDPDSPEELIEVVDRLLTDQVYTDNLRAKIAAAKPDLRTWRTVAGEVLDALCNVREHTSAGSQ